MAEPDLVPTSVAARRIGVATRTLQKWADDGLVEPEVVTPGGHMRWDVDRLREQLRAQRKRDE